ncbi:MAG: hypothetical protein ABSD72_19135 [Terracidiphilus sp.]|jgi:hypothetical protein
MKIREAMLLLSVALLVSGCKGRMFPASQANLSGDPPASASSQDAAQAGLKTMQSLVRPENYQGLGFSSVDQVKNAQLGDSLKVYRVPLDALSAYKGDANAFPLLQDAHKLIYPVTVDQQVVSSLSATQRDDGWRANEFGNSALTRALVARRASKDDFVVWVPALKIYFTARGEGEKLMLTTIMDDPRFDFKAGQNIPASQAFTTLQKFASSYNGLPQ